MPTAPSAEEILHSVRSRRPKGWRWFTLEHAKRVESSLGDQIVGSPSSDLTILATAVPRSSARLDDQSVREIAERVRKGSRPNAVGFGLSTIIGWLAWRLIETAVWWAIQWAWKREMGLDD